MDRPVNPKVLLKLLIRGWGVGGQEFHWFCLEDSFTQEALRFVRVDLNHSFRLTDM